MSKQVETATDDLTNQATVDGYFQMQTQEFRNAMTILAKLLRAYHQALVGAGFSSQEAMALTAGYQAALLPSAMKKKTGG